MPNVLPHSSQGDGWIDLFDPAPQADCENTGAACGSRYPDLTNLARSVSITSIDHVDKFKCDECREDDKQCFKFKIDGGDKSKLEGQECDKEKKAICSITCSQYRYSSTGSTCNGSTHAATPSAMLPVVPTFCASPHYFAYDGGTHCCDANTDSAGNALNRDASTDCSGNSVACPGGATNCKDAGRRRTTRRNYSTSTLRIRFCFCFVL